MDSRPPILLPALAAYVLGSSVLGLAAAMATAGPRIFGIVWGASLLGDVIFVGGMSAVGIGAFHLARGPRWWVSVLLGLVGSWLVYTLAWSVTAPAISPENNQGFASAGPEVWGFTLQWGWPGMLFSCAFPVVLAFMLRRHASGAPAGSLQQEEPKRHP
jgi:hypothetical protein